MNETLEFVYDFSDQVCFKVEKTDHHVFPFEFFIDDDKGAFESMMLTTAEAKALLKFLKKHLEPKLENV